MGTKRFVVCWWTFFTLFSTSALPWAAETVSPKIGPFLQKRIMTESRDYQARRDGDGGLVDVILVLEGAPLEALPADVAAAVENRVTAVGGTVGDRAYNKVKARVPMDRIEDLAGWARIRQIRRPLRPGGLSTQSEGLAVMNVPAWHDRGVTGSGVKAGVIDMGFAKYTDLLGRDLPDTVVTHITGSSREFASHHHGTACAEILHDSAPGADLYLVNAGDWDVDFHNAVQWLLNEDVQVVSSSIGINFNIISELIYELVNGFSFNAYYASMQLRYIDELRAQWDATINGAVSRGITWVQAAGNDGTKRWKSEFVDADGDEYLDFEDGDNANEILLPDFFAYGIPVYVVLAWGEDESTDDYDLYVTDASGGVVARSTIIQPEMPEFPMEVCRFFPFPGERYFAKVHNYDAMPQVVSLNIGVDGFANYEHHVPVGTVKMAPPADNPNVITVGAVDFAAPYEIEAYSSQGPNADDVIKPDVTAPDRVSTEVYGPDGFPGTSAAAPHVAGICAMILQYYPDLAPAEVKGLLEDLALDLGAPGKDNVFGAGLVMLPRVQPYCIEVGPDLALDLVVDHLGTHYSLTLGFQPNPADPGAMYWRMDAGALYAGDTPPADALLVGADLGIDLCADHQGTRYFAPLEFHNRPDDPEGLYWRLDPDALRTE